MVTKSYIVGLPESGKTTFLGALAYTIQNAKSGSVMYKIDEIEDFRYLYDVSNVWSSCEKVGRTIYGQYENIVLFLKDPYENKIQLLLPDQSGEEFEQVIKHRMMSNVMHEDIVNCDDILLFINPNNISNDVMINEIPCELRQEFQDDQFNNGELFIHEQVQYVMLLQDIAKIKRKKVKLKIVISAWDAYGVDESPKDLLKLKLPLLWQYLISNEKLFECEYWGISAQGGNLDIQEEKDKLLEYEDPIERITITGQYKVENTHDLTILLR